MKVAVVDYGMGNLRSVAKAIEYVGFKEVSVTSDPETVRRSEVLVFPGQGAFKKAMENLKKLSLISPILSHIDRGKPFLGICLGLQLLFERSYEHGETEGLGVFEGEVILLPPRVKIPHIGWNQVWIKKERGLYSGIKDGDFFYFVHSYHVVPKDESVIASTTDYEVYFVSAVEKENVWAVQFHPEKSQSKGLRLLENFKNYCEAVL
ncbi:glutamine amidotransferase [Hydrogenivirga caldilitoris]|uniref:Imidazole glycerol phosphate synthase subunit HisH n=1 Tax=Hydrogenivirga caldilitoris TaxID=246264 RepID=A0A497XRA9_9AQUI|nr:imidazole glycerol phosphate synthase subunit HisH [Hydrogenivirga caldilitoris]RLJ70629.1 glutamine amidotransferase [Hydrogenivirga caldilitoris]